ncbi:nuclear transport factor 2 family protein [Streptomyces zingiberis]|uniref:SnoaL-like domain-containing protein n=1 Tax=Streptomyces zingiberis TaxID=2053010 RepID=A0ABX1C1L5_9ACTN|nr:nuclear transport factor 2 family protein [Streptomyces zingiberis]NJQ01852.1 SnoaL-like domain-containing protein [Streptomyces zingiberis]
MASPRLAIADLPAAVGTYLRAHADGDAASAAAVFTPQATVIDDGHTHRGAAAIAAWLTRSSSEYTYTTTFVGAEGELPGQCTVTQQLDGDFPGSSVRLRYRFLLDGGLISHLEIAP